MQRTPSQTVGPFFLDALIHAGDEHVANLGASAHAKTVVIQGVVYDGEGAAVSDAFLEIYVSRDAQRNSAATAELRTGSSLSGFGRAATVNEGAFRFSTQYPVAGTDAGLQSAPHLELMIFARGLLKPLVTRIYFDGDPNNARDVILNAVPAARRATLLAIRDAGTSDESWRFDVRLQGKEETVFFDL